MIGSRRIGRRDWVPAASWVLAMGLALWGDAVPVRLAASAQLASAQPDAADAHGTAEQMTREQAARMLQVRYGTAAKVVRTDVVEQDGHPVYVFRLLSVNGRIWIVHIDARSGTEVP